MTFRYGPRARATDPISVLPLFRLAIVDLDDVRHAGSDYAANLNAEDAATVRAELAVGGFDALAWLLANGHESLLLQACARGRLPQEYADALVDLATAEGRLLA